MDVDLASIATTAASTFTGAAGAAAGTAIVGIGFAAVTGLANRINQMFVDKSDAASAAAAAARAQVMNAAFARMQVAATNSAAVLGGKVARGEIKTKDELYTALAAEGEAVAVAMPDAVAVLVPAPGDIARLIEKKMDVVAQQVGQLASGDPNFVVPKAAP